MAKPKALFLDRDGVINKDYGYVRSRDNFDFIEGVFKLCKQAQDRGFIIIIVTNQSAIGRGLISERNFLKLCNWMEEEMNAHGINIAKIYYSPYHPIFGIRKYKKDSTCRKPNPGMFIQAEREFNIDMTESLNVGNNIGDIEAGKKANVKNNFLFVCADEVLRYSSENHIVISKLDEIFGLHYEKK